MFIHIGGEKVINTSELIAIFDIAIEQTKISQQFMNQPSNKRKIERCGEEVTKSIIITNTHIYYSPVSATTLKKRSGLNNN